MKKVLMLSFLVLPLGLSAQEVQRADALVSPRIAERELRVGGEDAYVSGYNNHSMEMGSMG